jgi:hypothetical protein
VRLLAPVLAFAAAVAAAEEQAAEPRRLTIPSYALVGGDPLAAPIELPTVHERVDVVGKPMDTEWLTAKMEWWLMDYDLVYGPMPPIAYGAPMLHDMYDHRPHGAPFVTLNPIFDWVTDKIKKKP